jgi:phage protein D
MGRVTEPIPFWSRLYDGAWFRLKIEEGYTLSEESMAKIKAAVAKAYEGVEQLPPAPIPGVKPGRKASKASKAPKAVTAEEALEQLPVVPVEPIAPKRRANVKKPTVQQPVAKVEGSVDVSEHEVVQIKVRKQEVDGRMFYLDSKKDKLYDMKFKYVGRLKDGAVVSHPDSDADL